MMRIVVATTVGALVAILLDEFKEPNFAAAVGWDSGAAVFLTWTWLAVGALDSAGTESHATREEPSRPLSDVLVLAAAVASLTGVGYLLFEAHSAHGIRQLAVAGVGVGSVAISWIVVHTVYTTRYAGAYYTDSVGGVDFNQKERPTYVDFAYLAFTIGMTFQVSDTNLTKANIRAIALRHALLSYLFGAVILAATVNLLAGIGT